MNEDFAGPKAAAGLQAPVLGVFIEALFQCLGFCSIKNEDDIRILMVLYVAERVTR